ncbi:hypothetical protein IMSHALPRED_008285 [Imshaugia aleurites]|uniref:Uncharacterized protein n=1 Tax=Imshaugia aleurites TaxID=172621 RepID=A0A8H3FXC4_9LECA|nr:hypothetical protein IMSHALPRED_008285 [Imshaugia aleurites]
MGGYLKPLPRLCPKSEHMYTVKMQEFETYARRDIRIEAVIIAPELDALIGGLLIKWVRIQRCNVERDEFSIISGNALQPSELEQVASALHGSGCMDSLRV